MANETDSIMQSMIENGLIVPPPTPTEPIPAEPPVTEPAPTPAATEPIPTPPVEAAPSEPAPAEPAPIPTSAPINELEIINKTLGTNYTSLDDAKNDFTELPTLKELKNQPKIKFANDSFAELNNFALATGIEDAGIFKDLKRFTNTEQKDPIEAMVLADMITNPSSVDDKETSRQYFKSKYNTTINEEADPIEEANRIKMVEYQMKRDAIAANKTISDTMGKITEYKAQVEPDNTKAIQEAKIANQSAWETVLADNKFTDLLNNIVAEVPLGKQDDEIDLGTETVKYELTAAQKQSAVANIKNLIAQGLPCTTENMNAAIEFEQLKALKENLPSLLISNAKQFLAKQKEIMEAKYHNKSQPPKIETPVPAGKEKGEITDVSAWALEHMNQMS